MIHDSWSGSWNPNSMGYRVGLWRQFAPFKAVWWFGTFFIFPSIYLYVYIYIHIFGMSSSQMTYIFQRGSYTTNQKGCYLCETKWTLLAILEIRCWCSMMFRCSKSFWLDQVYNWLNPMFTMFTLETWAKCWIKYRCCQQRCVSLQLNNWIV